MTRAGRRAPLPLEDPAIYVPEGVSHEFCNPGDERATLILIMFGETRSSSVQDNQTETPNSEPTADVRAIARAPQKDTRNIPRHGFAPPMRAAV